MTVCKKNQHHTRMYKSLLFLALILFISCEEELVQELETVTVDVTEAKVGVLEELSDNVRYINLDSPEEISIGAIYHIKHYGKYLFLHDQFQTRSITVVDTSGNYITQLKQIGRGPGEYSSIDAFSFDQEKKELIVYDRMSGKYTFYSFPELGHIRSVEKNRYIMNFEVLDSDGWFVVTEDRGAEIWDSNLNTVSPATQIGNDQSSIEVSYPNTISRIEEEIYYSYPSEYTTVYELGEKEQMPVISIDFGENRVPLEYWETSDPYKFEESLTTGNLKAAWVQHLSMDEESLAFWFLYKDIATRYFAIHDRESEESQVYTELRINGTDIRLDSPIGVMDNAYISTIYPESIESVGTIENKSLLNSLTGNNQKLTPILAVYTLNNIK